MRARAVNVLLALPVLLVSCASPTVQVLYGNYHQSKGEYAQATINYFRALEHGRHEEMISYDLGNVYRSLGETEAARDALASASSSERDGRLLFRSYFNLGHISYEASNFGEAVRYYILALKVEPSDWDAKVNLELSLRQLRPEARQPAAPGAPLEEADREVLEFVKQREEELWKTANGEPEFEEEDW